MLYQLPVNINDQNESNNTITNYLKARPLLNVFTMLPTASLLRRGLPGLSKFRIFSGESELTTTLATGLGFLQPGPSSLLEPLLVTRELLGEWKSWKCLGMRDLAISVPQTGQGVALVFLLGLSGGSRTGSRRELFLCLGAAGSWSRVDFLF